MIWNPEIAQDLSEGLFVLHYNLRKTFAGQKKLLPYFHAPTAQNFKTCVLISFFTWKLWIKNIPLLRIFFTRWRSSYIIFFNHFLQTKKNINNSRWFQIFKDCQYTFVDWTTAEAKMAQTDNNDFIIINKILIKLNSILAAFKHSWVLEA